MLTSLDDTVLGINPRTWYPEPWDLLLEVWGEEGSGKGRLRRGAHFKPNGMYGIFDSGVLINNLTLLSSLQS